MIDRRKFLERSVMSGGSVLFSSVLLESCTKLGIPLPGAIPLPGGTTPTPPSIGLDTDWNDDLKIIVTSAVKMIPEAGEILGPLLEILWPSTQEDVWGAIKYQVENLINQKMDAAVYTQVSEDLHGLNNSIVLYLNELKNGTSNEILTQWMITKNLFVNALPHFQSVGNELPLLPLHAQFTNLYLGLLRDGVAFGQKDWGRTAADHQQDIQDLKNAISSIGTYTQKTYNDGRNALLKSTKSNSDNTEPWTTINKYDRQMSLTVLDYFDAWPYFDVSLYPQGTTQMYNREIYSDPYGTSPDNGAIAIPTSPTQFPTNLTVWAWDRLDAVQLTYPPESGPGGNTTTPRMGDQGGGSNQLPRGGSFDLSSDNPITAVRALTAEYYNTYGYVYGPFVSAVQFQFQVGSTTSLMGSLNGAVNGLHSDTGLFGFTNRALSSIHVNGASKQIGSADIIVFGFQSWTSPAVQLSAIQTLYIKTPKERSVADFAKAFPKLAIPSNVISNQIKASRKAYWEKIKTQAEALGG